MENENNNQEFNQNKTSTITEQVDKPVQQPQWVNDMKRTELSKNQKDSKKAMWYSVSSIIMLFIGIFFGFASLFGFVLGFMGVSKAYPVKHKLPLIVGSIGAIANIILLVLFAAL